VDAVPTLLIYDEWGGTEYAQVGFTDARQLYDALIRQGPPARQRFRELSAYAFVLATILGVFFAMWPLYFTLLLTNKLPSGEFLRDILTVGLVGIGVSALTSMIPCVGLIVAIILLSNLYDMGFLDFIIYFALQAVLTAIYFAILFALIGPALLDLVLTLGL